MIQENNDFETLIRKGSYVDKTEYIYRLAKHPTSICITRPGGFGKTLFCSTYKALFEGGRIYSTDSSSQRTQITISNHILSSIFLSAISRQTHSIIFTQQ